MLPSPPRPKNDDERILPLINVVFLLLIFFMLTGQLAATDPFEVAPPESLSEGLVESRDLVLLVGADGRLALDGDVLPTGTEIADALAKRLAAEPDQSAKVWIKADGRADATKVIGLLESLRDAGVESVSLLTLPEGQ